MEPFLDADTGTIAIPFGGAAAALLIPFVCKSVETFPYVVRILIQFRYNPTYD